ncbi:hypothetical protein ACWDE0_18980 [Streptomyces sp. 900105755]|uniref:hypothetical protein n=1 Tax=unclassified Streptomyces TaxID=2593676 RepID=UPI000895D365|nr:hypothetical protein [Streptomyces sp. Ag109_O5-10]SEF13958.1 urease accessory protein [Streptomyces sp. Ag109_O5-10]
MAVFSNLMSFRNRRDHDHDDRRGDRHDHGHDHDRHDRRGHDHDHDRHDHDRY